ncbi:hypothetical protein BDF22DRAFT_652991 [Syncephalis plumigaleata]|nr:hypothetical protein BDF22DRAFT_652991 [Syncephalis plumigaleata]
MIFLSSKYNLIAATLVSTLLLVTDVQSAAMSFLWFGSSQNANDPYSVMGNNIKSVHGLNIKEVLSTNGGARIAVGTFGGNPVTVACGDQNSKSAAYLIYKQFYDEGISKKVDMSNAFFPFNVNQYKFPSEICYMSPRKCDSLLYDAFNTRKFNTPAEKLEFVNHISSQILTVINFMAKKKWAYHGNIDKSICLNGNNLFFINFSATYPYNEVTQPAENLLAQKLNNQLISTLIHYRMTVNGANLAAVKKQVNDMVQPFLLPYHVQSAVAKL